MEKYKRHTIDSMQEHAKIKGGSCLSEKYINSKTHLLWQCKEGHNWKATSSNILRGKWCPKCAGKEKLDIEIFRTIAKNKGGKLISNQYENIEANMEWECSEGHRWMATGHNVKLHNTWCKTCSGNDEIGLEKLKQIAIEKRGLLLSTEYINRKHKYLWECEFGHQWRTSAYNVYYDGHWCPHCYGNKKLSLQDLQDVAIERKGYFLSKKYENIDSVYKWKCSRGHVWEATGDKVKNRGTWCPKCSQNHFKEDIIRVYFKALFNAEFPKKRPDWLLNSAGQRMELDGFNEELSIAFEYNGVQHYEKNHFIDTDEKLLKRIEDDKQKQLLCEKKSIALFIIDYQINPEEYKNIIIQIAKQFKIDNLLNIDAKIDVNDAYLSSDYFEKLTEYVKMKNGIIFDKFWFGFAHHYKFKCLKHNLIFYSTGSILTDKSWCKKCGKEEMVQTKYLNRQRELIDYASKNNSKLISKEYTGQLDTYEFSCQKNHTVRITWKYRNKRKFFCPKCEELPIKKINFIKEATILHGSKYDYSKVSYTKSIDKVIIICPFHGEFKKEPRKHIGRKEGCPECSKKRNENAKFQQGY